MYVTEDAMGTMHNGRLGLEQVPENCVYENL